MCIYIILRKKKEGSANMICVVILHYNTIDETIACVESIKKRISLEGTVKIIIVDNLSSNGTGQRLVELYNNDKNIDIILSDHNLGFAKGNNLGYVHAMKKYNPDFIILSNNDVIIEQDNFFQKIVDFYGVNDFAVCGPDIIVPHRNMHQNPLSTEGHTLKTLNKTIWKYRFKLSVFRISRFLRIYDKILLLKNKVIEENKSSHYLYHKENIVIHGSFLIFSKKYLDIFPNGLYDKTFMYMEEFILFYLCNKNGLKIVYNPDLQIIHNEGVATRQSTKSRVDKNIFEFRHTLESAYLFREIMINDKKNIDIN